MRKFFWSGGLLAMLLAMSSNAQTSAYRFAGVDVPPPLPIQNVQDVHWGTKVDDPYRFLEQVKDPAVVTWMRGQADAADAILNRLPGRQTIFNTLKEKDAVGGTVVSSIHRTAGNRWFYLMRPQGQSQAKLVWRDGLRGEEKLLVDPELITKEKGKPHAVQSFYPSPDGKLLAYGMHSSGSEIGNLYVIDVATGKEVLPPIDRIRFAGVSWRENGSGLFFSRLRPGYETMKSTERFADTGRYYLDLKQPNPDHLIFNASMYPQLKLPSFATGGIAEVPGSDLAAMVVYFGVDRRLAMYVAKMDDVLSGKAQWREVFKQSDDVREVDIGHGHVYVRSALNAPRFKVLKLKVPQLNLSQAETLVPETEGVLRSISVAKDALYVTRREGVNTALLRIPASMRAGGHDVQKLTLPLEGNVNVIGSPDHSELVVAISSWTQALRRYVYAASTGQFERLLLAPPVEPVQKVDIVAREVMVPSHDGVKVPVSIIMRADAVLNGQNPTILYGYGAYGTTEEPGRSTGVITWVERGGIYAFAHVRGGGALGSQWHMAGHKTSKYNTWKDGIAAAEWLIANGYTSSSKLGIYGGSAGGVFVGRAITERPDLFAAAVPSVPVLDMVRSEQRANGVANIPEYGSVKVEAEFHALLRNSAYHAVKDGVRYPATMLMHGVNDSRVDVWQSLKFASRIADAQKGQQAVLLRLDYQAGHGSGSGADQAMQRTADLQSFMLWQMGEAGFQPQAK
ncbi:MAG: Prolyl endopeptidase [Pseudomonadota bacterium]|jgi:prolyl oligopeptidase